MIMFLFGNGFDLHYKLPTSYRAFLQTVSYLLKLSDSGNDITSVAQVFGAKELRGENSQISACVDTYGADYDAVIGQEVTRICTLAKNNFWFSYLKNADDTSINWVDFENEIARVIHTLERNKSNIGKKDYGTPLKLRCYIKTDNDWDGNILSKLDFLEKYGPMGDGNTLFFIAPEYICIDPPGSNNLVVNWESISEYLSNSLKDLTEMLAFYLQVFIEAPLLNLIEQGVIKKDLLLDSVLGGVQDSDGAQVSITSNSAFVVTFNYTRTCEYLYPNTKFSSFPTHIHGSLSKADIVLGIHSDEADEIAPVDTTFLPFKKFYQRILYGTSRAFYSLCAEKDRGPLYVIGHSLDETDQEIIKELFRVATRITIFCHSPEAKADYIHKLTRVYTKSGIEVLVKNQDLRFVDIAQLNDKDFVEKEGLANR